MIQGYHGNLPKPVHGAPIRGYSPSQTATSDLLDLLPWIKSFIALLVSGYAVFVSLGPLFFANLGSVGFGLCLSNALLLLPYIYVLVISRRSYVLFSPIYFIFLMGVIHLILRKTPSLLLGLSAHAAVDLPPESLTWLLIYANVLTALGLGCFIFGASVRKRHSPLPLIEFLPISRVGLPLLVSLTLGGGIMIYLVSISGNIVDHILNVMHSVRARILSTGDLKGFGHIFALASLPVYAVMMWIAARRRIEFNPLFWIIAVGALVLIYLTGGKRAPAIYAAMQFGIIWCLVNRRIPYYFAVVGAVSTLFLVGLLGTMRQAAFRATDLETIQISAMDQGFVGGLTGAVEEMQYRSEYINPVYPILYEVPGNVPLLWGKGYATLLVRPIPRALWAGKPVGMDSMVGGTFFGSNWGMPAGILGEAYWNFHVVGIIGVYFFFGWVMKYVWLLYLGSPDSGGPLVIYAVSLISFQPSEVMLTNWLIAMGTLGILLAMGGGIRLRG